MVRWLERNGYDVSYIDRRRHRPAAASCSEPQDLHVRRPRRVLVRRSSAPTSRRRATPGSTWPSSAATRCSGRRAGRQHRRHRHRYRTLVSYKETHANAEDRPGRRRVDRHVARPALQPGRRRAAGERADRDDLHGQRRHGPRSRSRPRDGKCASGGTPTSRTSPGGERDAGRRHLGYEWDEDLDNGFRARRAGPTLVDDVDDRPIAPDYGLDLRTGTATHSLTLYRAPSGALVFGAGTVQWSWGLDDDHDRGSPQRPTPRCSRRR